MHKTFDNVINRPRNPWADFFLACAKVQAENGDWLAVNHILAFAVVHCDVLPLCRYPAYLDLFNAIIAWRRAQGYGYCDNEGRWTNAPPYVKK